MWARPLSPEGSFDVAGINECGVAEDRRVVPLANDQREPVGKHLDGDPLLEAFQILGRARASRMRAAENKQAKSRSKCREKDL